VRGVIGCCSTRAVGLGAAVVGCGQVLSVVAGVRSVRRLTWRGAGARSACGGAGRRAAGGHNGQPAAPRPLPAGAVFAAAHIVRREGSAGAGRSGGWRRGGGGPPAVSGGAVRSAVRGVSGAHAVPGQLWSAAAPRWQRRAVSGGGGSTRRRRRPRAVAPQRRRRPVGAAAVAAVIDAVAGSSTTEVDARQMGRWAPQPPSIAVSWEAPRRRTRRRRPHLRPSAKWGGRQCVSLVGHSSFLSGNAFRPKLR